LKKGEREKVKVKTGECWTQESTRLRAAPARAESGVGFVHVGMHRSAGSSAVMRADGGINCFVLVDG